MRPAHSNYDATNKLYQKKKDSLSSCQDPLSNFTVVESLVDKKIIVDEKKLARSILFACENCDGPLVPASICVICKKASSRICQKCSLQKCTGEHQLCLYVMITYRNKQHSFYKSIF